MKEVFLIKGMSCSHCSDHVKKAILEVPGVRAAEVELEKGIATVTLEAPAAAEAICAAVAAAGYEASLS